MDLEPLSFSKEVFSNESFNVDAFIGDCRRRVPLEAVLRDLRQHAKSLDRDLVDLVKKKSFFLYIK